MKMKIIRIAVIGAIAASLISILVASSYFDAQSPVTVDMSSVIEKLSIDASFQCSFISVDRLKQCTIMWQQPIPGSARDIWSLGADNVLVLTRIELSDESQHARRYEETICIFDSRGNLLAQKPIGEYQVKDVYQSNDGSLVNILTENDHNIVNIVTDPIGSSFLQIGYHSVLMPSWDGDFLINISGRGTGKTSTLVIDAGGEERKVAAARLLNKDGQALRNKNSK